MAKKPSPDDLLTVTEAAKLLGQSPSTVRAHLAAGRLPAAYQTGRLYLVRRADVERFTPPPRGRRPKTKPTDNL